MLSSTLGSLNKVLVAVLRVVRPLPTLLLRGGQRVAVERARSVAVMRASARPTLVFLEDGFSSQCGKPCTNHAHDPTKGGISENDPKKGTSVPCVIIRAVPPHAFT